MSGHHAAAAPADPQHHERTHVESLIFFELSPIVSPLPIQYFLQEHAESNRRRTRTRARASGGVSSCGEKEWQMEKNGNPVTTSS
jgi:hypothetical protein